MGCFQSLAFFQRSTCRALLASGLRAALTRWLCAGRDGCWRVLRSCHALWGASSRWRSSKGPPAGHRWRQRSEQRSQDGSALGGMAAGERAMQCRPIESMQCSVGCFQLLALLYRSTCNTYPACKPSIELHHTLQMCSRSQCWITRDCESQCATSVHLTCRERDGRRGVCTPPLAGDQGSPAVASSGDVPLPAPATRTAPARRQHCTA